MEESCGDGENVVTAMEDDCASRSVGWLPKTDVRNGAGSREDAETYVTPAGEAGDSLDYVSTSRDLEDVGAHGGFGFAGDEDGRLGFVLGSRRPASGSSTNFYGGSISEEFGRFGGFVSNTARG